MNFTEKRSTPTLQSHLACRYVPWINHGHFFFANKFCFWSTLEDSPAFKTSPHCTTGESRFLLSHAHYSRPCTWTMLLASDSTQTRFSVKLQNCRDCTDRKSFCTLSTKARSKEEFPNRSPTVAPSAARADQSPIPPSVPTRWCLERIRRLMTGAYYVGRGSRQRSVPKSLLCNGYKVAVYAREEAIRLFAIEMGNNQD